MTLTRIVSAALAAAMLAGPALAQESEDCKSVVFSDVGWTDITATTAVATTILNALGYETEIKVLSVPVTYTALSTDDV
ncbi:MAG: glycine betaine ABC transporter substrate-binding protein, partial [Paracoccus sp. (in: a-proteobacteria)]